MFYALNSKGNDIVKQLLISVLFILGIGGSSMAQDVTPHSQMTDELRSMILSLNPKDIGITKENFPHPVFAIIMETGFHEGSFTLSAVADGSTSMYYSAGGGIIEGGEHINVRKTSPHFLAEAQHFLDMAIKVNTFPKPAPGTVIFYFVTFDGVRSYSALEDDLGNEKSEFSHLFFAAYSVITELSKIVEERYIKSN